MNAPTTERFQRIKRTYITLGQISTSTQLQHNGALTIQTDVYVGVVPPTPSGFTRTSLSTQFVNGLPVYTAVFAKGVGQISILTEYVASPDLRRDRPDHHDQLNG